MSKVDYAIDEFICMLPSDMNLRIGNVINYNNKILISSPSFNIGTNAKINIDGEQGKLRDKPDVKSKEVEMVKTEPDVKPNKNTNKMLNLTSSSIEKANRMLRNLIRIRSPIRKKGCFDIGNYSCLYSMVDVQMTYLLLVFVTKYAWVKTPMPVISAH